MVSIIIPAHNAAATICDCLQALNNQVEVPASYEIIVVDDGSTDNTAVLSEATGATVLSQRKRGPAAARNLGLSAASGDIVCFTDADCIPSPTFLREITTPLRQNPDTTAVKGTYATSQRDLFARFVQIEYEDKYDNLRQYNTITFMDFYAAACRRQTLIDIGAFDERYPNSEDRELSYRLAAQGYQMVFQPTAVVSHHHAHTFWAYFRKKIANGYWTAQAVRQFPERRVDDSYTPRTQKFQIGLMGLLLPAVVTGLIFPLLLPIPLLLALIFLATTLRFTRKALPKDATIGALSPLLLAIRALALGLGYAWGTIRPI